MSARAFSYLGYYTWQQVGRWLRRKHHRAAWKDLRRLYYKGGAWWPASDNRQLFSPANMGTTRYRYRGTAIPAPWPVKDEQHAPERDLRSARCLETGTPGAGSGLGKARTRDLTGQPTLLMDLEHAGTRVKFVLYDRDSSFTSTFDAVLQAAGVRVIRSAVQVPRMNSIMERWSGNCRRELLDRTLIWNQRHLMTVLREYEDFYNNHRPYQAREQRPPLHEPGQAVDMTTRIPRRQVVHCLISEYWRAP